MNQAPTYLIVRISQIINRLRYRSDGPRSYYSSEFACPQFDDLTGYNGWA